MKPSARTRMTMPIFSSSPEWAHGTALDASSQLWLSSGRAAIALALQHSGISKGSQVLLPAFFCQSMIDSIEFCGMKPIFYKLTKALDPDVADLKQRLTPATKAILTVRYFGFGRSSSEFTALCQDNSLVVIEDRAHAFFGPTDPGADYVAYSLPKFFPVFEGGLLASNHRRLSSFQTERPDLLFEVKTLLWPFEYASEFGNADAVQKAGRFITSCKQRLKPAIEATSAPNLGPASANGGSDLEAYWINKRSTVATKLITCTTCASRAAIHRRQIWMHMLKALSGLSSLTPIFSQLPDDVVPYAFPFIPRHPDVAHEYLKSLSVPVYRWDSFAIKPSDLTLAETAGYSTKILQIPVHQSMTEDEVSWMCHHIRAAVSLAAS